MRVTCIHLLKMASDGNFNFLRAKLPVLRTFMGFLGTRGKGHIFQGNKGNKGQILREHGNKDNIREQGT